jgi:predicted nucleic acid-binding protein
VQLIDDASPQAIGSVLLLAEVLTKPTRIQANEELAALVSILSRLNLRPCDEATAILAVALGSAYALGAVDAVHLATAVAAGADRFITNNSRDFGREIVEIDITHPDELVGPEN